MAIPLNIDQAEMEYLRLFFFFFVLKSTKLLSYFLKNFLEGWDIVLGIELEFIYLLTQRYSIVSLVKDPVQSTGKSYVTCKHEDIWILIKIHFFHK